MPLFMDHHKGVEGLTAEAVADAHRKDMEIQEHYGVTYHRYWFNEESGEVWCLAEAPSKEAAEAVHREAHGLVADEITEVKEGSLHDMREPGFLAASALPLLALFALVSR